MYLLDTQVFLWWLLDRSRLSNITRETIRDTRDVYVSAASTWEISIKKGLGKLDAPNDLEQQITANRFITLPITIPHTVAVQSLPVHHSDPFDRILIAQARHESLVIVTSDDVITRYPVKVLAA